MVFGLNQKLARVLSHFQFFHEDPPNKERRKQTSAMQQPCNLLTSVKAEDDMHSTKRHPQKHRNSSAVGQERSPHYMAAAKHSSTHQSNTTRQESNRSAREREKAATAGHLQRPQSPTPATQS